MNAPVPSPACGSSPVLAAIAPVRPYPEIELACSHVPRLAGSWPVSPKQAADAVRAFLGTSRTYSVDGPYERSEGQVWSVWADGIDTSVDARTGEVVSASYAAHAPEPGDAQVSRQEAQARAEAYAREHRIDVAGLTSHVELAGEWAYAVRWERLDAGVAVPPRVQIVVDRRTGDVRSFSADRRAFASPLAPRIDRDTAIRLAIEEARRQLWVVGRGVDAADLRVDWAGLEVAHGWSGESEVFQWRIVLSAPSSDPELDLVPTVGVDAVTGATELAYF